MPLDGSNLGEHTKTLIAARELVERGWCQNKMRLGGDVCMVGAMIDVCAHGEAWLRLERATQTTDEHALANWNDTPGRTLEEVLRAFDVAIWGCLNDQPSPSQEGVLAAFDRAIGAV